VGAASSVPCGGLNREACGNDEAPTLPRPGLASVRLCPVAGDVFRYEVGTDDHGRERAERPDGVLADLLDGGVDSPDGADRREKRIVEEGHDVGGGLGALSTETEGQDHGCGGV